MRMRILKPRHQHIAPQIDLPFKACLWSACRANIDDPASIDPYFFIGEMKIRIEAQNFSVVKTNHVNLLL